MAKIGLNNFRIAVATVNASTGAITYANDKKPSKAVTFNFEPTVSEASLFADDILAESDYRVTGGNLTLGLASEDLDIMSMVLGHTKGQDDEFTDNVNDTIPYVGVGRVTVLMVNNVKKYRATVLRLCKFQEPSEDETTMGESIEFGTYELPGKLVIPQDGDWRTRQVFDTQAEAIAYIEDILGTT